MPIKSFTVNGRVPVTVVHVYGNIDMSTHEMFQAKVSELIRDGARRILIDLTDSHFVSKAGFRVFYQLFNTLRAIYPDENLTDYDVKKGIGEGTYTSPHIKLLNLTNESKTGFRTSGLDMLIETFTDMKTAVASF